ncbi:hypothetical protein [Aquabacter sediminis]|uniref:hypothetical protein n=1 Tax=Aquabacter sediminis TaxID=3029197 RepID=UPI00237D5474|nr:hypothetical protein [Aquabacter sp. P-9]MDE1567874.1 hypothetical protein [Aquabacter sp. P-9]
MDDDVIALIATALTNPDPDQRHDSALSQQRAMAVLSALRTAGYEVIRRADAGEPDCIPPQELNASNDG